MSAGVAGAGAGAVLGIVLVFLAQQLGFLSLSDLTRSIEYLAIAAVIGGVVFGLIGWMVGKRRQARSTPAAGNEDA